MEKNEEINIVNSEQPIANKKISNWLLSLEINDLDRRICE